jgi:hypothetical protein
MIFRPFGFRRGSLACAAAALFVVLTIPGCGGGQRPAASPRPERPKPAEAVSPVDFGGQKVLILPLQASSALPVSREQATAELVFALTERDTRTQWVTPDQLRAALRRAPGFSSADPAALPNDTYLHHGERYIIEPLAGAVRRFTALMDTRLVLIPREARWMPAADGSGGHVRMSAAVVDSRSGNVVWFGEADGRASPQADAGSVATAAAALATRMVVPSER